MTAGNSSTLNDGVAALLLAEEEELRAMGREPLVRIATSGVSGIER